MARKTKKQPNSEGERPAYNHQRKRWQARYTAGFEDILDDETGKPTGRQRQVRKLVTGKDAAEVRARLVEAKKALESGAPPPDPNQTFGAYAAWWSKTVLPHEGLAPATVAFYNDILNGWVLPHIGRCRLTGRKALRAQDVETMTAALVGSGKSPRSALAARTVTSKILHHAQRNGTVSVNVARLATMPKTAGAEQKAKAMRSADVAGLLAVMDGTRWHPMVLLHAATGLRPGELCGLRWSDLDGENVTITRSLSTVEGITLKAPKRERSRRTVPVPAEVLAVLEGWRKTQITERLAAGSAWQTQWGDMLFTREDGSPVRPDTYRHAFSDAARQVAGLGPGWAPHSLRHTYATHLLEAGAPIHHVAELLGDTVATVEDTYKHVLRPKVEAAALIRTLLPAQSAS